MAGNPIAFVGAPVDRAPLERRQAGWLAAKRADPHARALLVSERGVWVEDGHLMLVPPGARAVFLGMAGDRPLFAADATGCSAWRSQ